MEVKGQLITSSSYSSADALGWEPGARLRLQELLDRQRGLREALGLRVAELRRLCLQEAIGGSHAASCPGMVGSYPAPSHQR
ncbi:acid-sensing ion channel 3 [Platysternon megacephalum]|uniref:Acid-sensing ion channel 3 n=1 Tax=Platysternon megacephalum TaxID=55544 RepID=A0A4D9DPY3_9SAUR|nr:acid-sensing ion channel 3 [Platysternon megacephalum]